MANPEHASANEARRHHYAPQFYLRQFACDQARTEAMVLARHHDFVVGEAKTISRMGYEDDLHAIEARFGRKSIEWKIARDIESPIAQSPTWTRIVAGDEDTLGEGDVAVLYLLCRHLERRNVATLMCIESEQRRIGQPEFGSDYSEEERLMHAAIAAALKGDQAFFLEGVLQTQPILAELDEVGITICRSALPLRSSTNPALSVPFRSDEATRRLGSGQPARAWWLPLSRGRRALVSLRNRHRGLVHAPGEIKFVRRMNQLYLVQLLPSPPVRYCLADDPHVDEDLVWAGYQLVRRGERKLRYVRAHR